jgi:hypothetical protein
VREIVNACRVKTPSLVASVVRSANGVNQIDQVAVYSLAIDLEPARRTIQDLNDSIQIVACV